MTFRWFGPDQDPIPLDHIRQIPGVRGVVGAVWDVPVGEPWPEVSIQRLAYTVREAGLELAVIESVNVHEDIKLGLPSRDQWIAHYIVTLRRLAAAGIKVVCYNFMPVFDWFRTDLAFTLPDGSNALYYDASLLRGLAPEEAVKLVLAGSQGFSLPGWEPARLGNLNRLLQAYKGVTADDLRAHLGYFLKAVIPVCEEVGIRMALHPDDPPWSLFGLPRIVTDGPALRKVLQLYDSPNHGLTLCSGSLGANPANDIPALVREFAGQGRVPFAHIRNIRFTGGGSFVESSHLSSDGSLDLFAIVQAYHEAGFDGYVRPDHGRMVWGEVGRPGYGLYDRAMGITYLNGLWEAITRSQP